MFISKCMRLLGNNLSYVYGYCTLNIYNLSFYKLFGSPIGIFAKANCILSYLSDVN
jgi:hypothetical protein